MSDLYRNQTKLTAAIGNLLEEIGVPIDRVLRDGAEVQARTHSGPPILRISIRLEPEECAALLAAASREK